MSAHRPKPVVITPEIVERFAAYHRRHPAWGAFHVSLDDGNFKLRAGDYLPDGTDEERALVDLHNLMSPSQRSKLARRVEALRA